MRPVRSLFAAVFALISVVAAAAQPQPGYYRQPAIHGDTIVFVSEGDLWKVPVAGGVATRLTSHAGEESRPAISPGGKTVAFTAQYEGPTDVHTMPLTGGLPTRRTWDDDRISFVGWTPDGKLLAGLYVYSTLPNYELVTIDVTQPGQAGARTRIPLAQAADASFTDDGKTLFFTRLPFQGSHTRRYKGGTAQNIWRFAEGDAEAAPLTADYAGTSRRPMFWAGRVYFASDRDGVMNLWSMKPDGSDLKQHTHHKDYEVLGPSLGGGRIVYQHGADIRLYDIAADKDVLVPITLDSDFDQMRERWITKPMDYVTSAHPSPDGSRVVLTARGEVIVAPHRQGRLVDVPTEPAGPRPADASAVRCRDARFMPDGKTLLTLSDASGEVELWTLPANGVGPPQQLTTDGTVLRWEALPSPDGKLIAHHDKNQRLFVFNVETKENKQIDESKIADFADLRWSPDSQWLAYVATVDNLFRVVRLYRVADGVKIDATTDRFDSFSPAWSADGKWLYFLSDRNLKSIVDSPWGPYQPEPFLDKTTKIYYVALTPGQRSPWAPANEIDDAAKEPNKDAPATKPAESAPATASAPASAEGEKKKDGEKPAPPVVTIDPNGLRQRVYEVPIPAGNYGSLSVNDKALFWTASATDDRDKTALSAANIARDNVEVKTVLADIKGYELSGDGKKLLIRKGDSLYLIDAAASAADLDKKDVNLAGWQLALRPRDEWEQMFVEAWRLERDYFYDPNMHAVDWKAMLAKYRPLLPRVRTRGELSDLVAQMVAELAALHIFVYGGDLRKGTDDIAVASLGAALKRDAAAGGWRVEHAYASDSDEPARRSPLAALDVNIVQGDVIEQINGRPTADAPDINALLRGKAGKQVLLRVKPAAGGEPRDVIVAPISPSSLADLRYHEWELTRRRIVEEKGAGQIGYVHLRAMGNANFTEWCKGFYPVFNRQGLIIDMRSNRGGNIDSWILGRLLRKAWFYWTQRVGQQPLWNMQYAFRGHMVVLCNEYTASDGEAFSEGFKRLGLGKVLGTRTWGGEIWLSSNNFLVDKGIATAAEYGVFGPEGVWLIEGHGVEPDIVVDNLPHATFKGQDAQLDAAIAHLQQLIKEKPVPPVQAPRHPDKSR